MSLQPLVGPLGGSAPTRSGMTANAEVKNDIFGSFALAFDNVIEQAPGILGEAAVNELRKATHTQTVNAFDKPNGLGLSGNNGNAPSGFSLDNKTLLIGGGLVLGAVALFALS